MGSMEGNCSGLRPQTAYNQGKHLWSLQNALPMTMDTSKLNLAALQTGIGTVGIFTGLAALLSPTPTFLQIIQRGSTEKLSCAPYICTLLASCAWAYYGSPLVAKDTSLMIINLFGIVIQSIFCVIFLTYAQDGAIRRSTYRLLVIMLVFVGAGALASELIIPDVLKATAVGLAGDFASVLACASPISSLAAMMRTKNVAVFPLALCVTNFINTCLWMVYGISRLDAFIALPNLVGMLLSGMQVVLFLVYSRGERSSAYRKVPSARKYAETDDRGDIEAAQRKENGFPGVRSGLASS